MCVTAPTAAASTATSRRETCSAAAPCGGPAADTAKWEAEIDARVFHLYGLTEEEMLTVLNSFPKMSIVEKTQIQNFYRDLERGNLK